MTRSIGAYLRALPNSTWLLAASGWVTLWITHLPMADPVRFAGVFAFLVVCPGLALCGLLPVRGVERWTVGIALSIALGLLISTLLTLARVESVAVRIGVIAAVTTLAALASPSVAGRRVSE